MEETRNLIILGCFDSVTACGVLQLTDVGKVRREACLGCKVSLEMHDV